jgi:hypothetical protein
MGLRLAEFGQFDRTSVAVCEVGKLGVECGVVFGWRGLKQRLVNGVAAHPGGGRVLDATPLLNRSRHAS